MTEGYYELDRDLSGVKRDLSDLESEFHDKANTLESDIRSAESDLQDHSVRLDEFEAEVADLQRDQGDQERSLSKVEGALRQLGGRISLLEQHLARQGGARVCDLDTVDEGERTTVERARKLDDLEARILPDYRRAVLGETIEYHRRQQKECDQREAEALAVAAELATTSWTSLEHTDAGQRFRSSWAALTPLRTKLAEAAERSTEARVLLRHDDNTRPTIVPQLAKAQTAMTQVRTHIRGRLVVALQDGLLLPAWFTEVFGARPPNGRDGNGWLDTAVKVVAYRILYGITDPISPLGPPTERATAQGRRRAELIDELRRVNPNI